MPKCQSCAANYDDNYRYCPYCGTAKPIPQVLAVQGADPRLYEEGVLRLKCILETQVIGSYRGWFGKISELRSPVRINQIELVGLSHEKGQYIALTSATFRHLLPTNSESTRYLIGYGPKDLEEPLRSAQDFVETGKQYDRGNNDYFQMQQTFFEALCHEQKKAWESFNESLRNEGWFGITDEAIGRRFPFDILAEGSYDWYDYKPKDPYKEPYYMSHRMRNHRYRRQI
jgi:hypothetical protein